MKPLKPFGKKSLISRINHRLFYSAKSRNYLERIDLLCAEVALLSSYSADTVYRLDYATMRYSYISRNVTRLLGYSPDEIGQMNVRSLIEETRLIDDGITTVESYVGLEQMRKNREINKWQADYLMRTKDGHAIWVADISYADRDDAGNIIGSIGSLRDITGRVYAEMQMKEAMGELAVHDGATGMFTRKAYFHRLDEELRRVKRSRSEVSLVLMEIDNLRNIAQERTPEFKDFVMSDLTRIIHNCLRETDVAARIETERFAFILPDTMAESAFWVAERIRTSLQNHSFTNARHTIACKMQLSFGIVTSRSVESLDVTDLHEMALKRLSYSKQESNNAIIGDDIGLAQVSGVFH